MALKTQFSKIAARIRATNPRIAQEVAQYVADYARLSVPVDTGALHDSITILQDKKGNPVVRAGGGLNYARYVEYGTSKMAARPFMRPAAEAGRKKLLEIGRIELRKIIR